MSGPAIAGLGGIPMRFVLGFFLAVFVLFAPRLAHADRVAVLPFVSVGSTTTSAHLGEARSATRAAVTQLKHTLPTDPQMVTAEMAYKGGTEPSAANQAAGQRAAPVWPGLGRAECQGATYRPRPG